MPTSARSSSPAPPPSRPVWSPPRRRAAAPPRRRAAAPPDEAPATTAITALAETSGAQLAQYGEWAQARRDLVASSADLRERSLIKSADLAAAIAAALQQRGVAAAPATLTAHTCVTAFTVGYDRWADGNGTGDLPAVVRQTLDDLRTAISD